MCILAILFSFTILHTESATEPLLTVTLDVLSQGTVSDWLQENIPSTSIEQWIEHRYDPLYEVRINVNGFKEITYDSSHGTITGLVSDSGIIIVKFDDTKFDMLSTSVYDGIVEGTTNHAYLSWIHSSGKIAKNGYWGSLYFIPKENCPITNYSPFTISPIKVGTTGEAITKFNVDYYDGTGITPTKSNEYITAADAINTDAIQQIAISSDCYSNTIKPGDTFTITVNIENNPGIISFYAKVDANYNFVLSDSGATDTILLKGAGLYKGSMNPYYLNWIDATATQNNTANGAIATMTYTVRNDAAPGIYPITITSDPCNTCDFDWNEIDFGSTTINITIDGVKSESTITTNEIDCVTYNETTLNGYISTEYNYNYGFEFWENSENRTKIPVGIGKYSGNFSKRILLNDNTQYYYRAYMEDSYGDVIYGDTVAFKTPKITENNIAEIDYDFRNISLKKEQLEENPNMFFLNNFLTNNPDGTKILLGKNFDGIEYIESNTTENIFLNQFFIKEYSNNDYLRTMLSLFDVFVYNTDNYTGSIINGASTTIKSISDDKHYLEASIKNGDEEIDNIIIHLPDEVLKYSAEKTGEMLQNIVNDVSIKRYQSAINAVLNNDYQSNDKRTFEYERERYNYLDSLSTSAKKTKNVIDVLNSGKNNISEGLTLYQDWYENKILPKYEQLPKEILKCNQMLIEREFTADEYDIALRNLEKEYAPYVSLTFADENANFWKNKLEYTNFADDFEKGLATSGKILSIYDSTLGYWNTLNQLAKNEKRLRGTFTDLSNSTTDYALNVALNDYINKMDADTADYLWAISESIYNGYFKNKIQKKANEIITEVGINFVVDNFNSFALNVTDKVLANAQIISFGIDAGGFAAEKITSTETLLKKTIEIKYLWMLENELKILINRQLQIYKNAQTEELAEKLINELLFLKAIKLRAITLTNEMYQANGDNLYVSLFYDDKWYYEHLDDVYESQRDALIGVSLIEGDYISQMLKIESGETCTIFNRNDLNHDGVISKNGDDNMLSQAQERLKSGVQILPGGNMHIANQNETVHIPYLMLDGGTLLISGTDVIIDELLVNNGNLIISENAKLTVKTDFNHTEGDIQLNGGEIRFIGNYNHTGGLLNVGAGTVEILGNYIAEKECNYSNPNKVRDCNIIMQDSRGYMLVHGNFKVAIDRSSVGLLTDGILELKGNFEQHGDRRGEQYYGNTHTTWGFCATENHKVVLSGDKQQCLSRETWHTWGGTEEWVLYPESSYFNILEIKNTSENGVKFLTRFDVCSNILQPIGTPIQSMNNVYINNKKAFMDYKTLNDAINAYNHNKLGVIPTYIDYNNYSTTQDLLVYYDNILTTGDVISGYLKWNEPKINNLDAVCVLAVFKNNSLVRCTIYPISIVNAKSDSCYFEVNKENGDNLRAFILSDLKSVTPLTEMICTNIY